MYSKPLVAVNTATGIALLPNTGNNHLLFALALGLLASGTIVFAVSLVLGRKGTQAN